MSFTSLATAIVPVLSEPHASEPALSPLLIGIGTFLVFMAMLVGLLMFGAGRDHS